MEIARGIKTRLVSKNLHQAAQDYLWSQDEELSRLNAEPACREPFVHYLDYYLAALTQGRPDRQNFAIETNKGQYIGNCSLYNIDHMHREAEVGITIGERNYWNQGYGSDALRALIRYGFTQMGLERLYLKTLVDNYPAQRCFIKCGFRQFGVLEINGYRFITMELLRDRWQEGLATSQETQRGYVR